VKDVKHMNETMGHPRRDGRLRCERGSQLVEFIMVVPFLLIIIAGISDFGLLFRAQGVVVNAAREGARLVVLPGNEEDDYATVRARISGYLASGGATGTAVVAFAEESATIAPSTVAGGVRVTITYTHNTLFMSPVLGIINGSFADAFTITTSAFMRTHIAAVSP
jgi:Flp pilus assembly protein TadG